MKYLSIITLLFLAQSCSAQTNLKSMKVEIEKWQKELFLNGEVGPPCEDDYHKWLDDNPNYYFGIQEISSKKFDFNSDGEIDGLFYFPAINCVGGNGTASDFAILVYSNNEQYLTNKKITEQIEEKIKYEFYDQGIYEISRTNISYTNLEKTIQGSFVTWRNEDANCCPSLQGNFEYNPKTFKVTLKYEDQKEK